MTDDAQMLERYRRVLIVEDEPRLAETYGRMMPEIGYHAATVGNGEAALDALAENQWPIVLLDLNLPGMSGLETLRKIREKWPNTQAIILTGFGDLDAAKEAIHLDVVEFLTKPCHLGDLETALDRAQRRIRKLVVEALGEQVADEQAAERAVKSVRDADEPDDAPASASAPAPVTDHSDEPPEDGPTSLAEWERKAIVQALDRHAGNRKAAADELGISVRTLYYRLDEYRKQGLIND